MPTIKRLSKPKTTYRNRERQKAYQKTEYRQLRNWHYQCHPLCQDCMALGLTMEGQDVHHQLSPFDPNLSPQESYRRLMDESNLVTLCRYHHNLRHGNCTQKEIEKFNEALKETNTNAGLNTNDDQLPHNKDS